MGRGGTLSLGEIGGCTGDQQFPGLVNNFMAQDPENSQLIPGPPLRNMPMALKRKNMFNMKVMKHETLAQLCPASMI